MDVRIESVTAGKVQIIADGITFLMGMVQRRGKQELTEIARSKEGAQVFDRQTCWVAKATISEVWRRAGAILRGQQTTIQTERPAKTMTPTPRRRDRAFQTKPHAHAAY